MLNNEMDDFSSKPGVPNMFGLGNEANSIALSKRMLSSMTPTIVEKNGKLFMVVGSQVGQQL
jgi:gamma-glutamyltranspeptidase/glutathione hydrolase